MKIVKIVGVILGVFLLLFLPITSMSSISSVNVIGNYDKFEDTPFYANIKEIYVDYLDEEVEPELKKKAKENYWDDYLAQQPAEETDEDNAESETEDSSENNTEETKGENAEASSKKAPDFKVRLISTMPNICYISSYLFATNEDALEDINKITLDKQEIFDFLDKVIEYEEEKKEENGTTIYEVRVVMKDVSELEEIFETKEEYQLFQDSYELTREVIDTDEVIYESLYDVNADGEMVLSSSNSSGTDGTEGTDFSGLEKLSSVPYYCQWDSAWAAKKYGGGTIKSSGCGPTCCAMVVSYFTGQTVTPADIVNQIGDKYYVTGKGSSWGLFPGVAGMYGIKCTDLGKNLSSVIDALRNGEIVIASMGPGTFTKGGHFIVLTGVTEDGKITVNDPAHPDFCSKTFDTSIFTSEAKNYWKFSK